MDDLDTALGLAFLPKGAGLLIGIDNSVRKKRTDGEAEERLQQEGKEVAERAKESLAFINVLREALLLVSESKAVCDNLQYNWTPQSIRNVCQIMKEKGLSMDEDVLMELGIVRFAKGLYFEETWWSICQCLDADAEDSGTASANLLFSLARLGREKRSSVQAVLVIAVVSFVATQPDSTVGAKKFVDLVSVLCGAPPNFYKDGATHDLIYNDLTILAEPCAHTTEAVTASTTNIRNPCNPLFEAFKVGRHTCTKYLSIVRK